jgi:long-chain acyl-CoA synthetase
MEKIWLQSYQKGVPAEIDLNEFQSLGELFEKSVGQYRDRVAYINMGAELTYGELDKLSRDFAAYLQSVLKLPQGTRVALMMPNVLQYPICIFGALRAGYVVVNVNPLYTPRELAHQLNDSGAEVIVILENFAVTLEQVVAKTPIKHIVVARLGDMLGFAKGTVVNFVVKYVKKMVPAWTLPRPVTFRAALAKGASSELKSVRVSQEDLAFLQYTGGTTSRRCRCITSSP